jgi:hypothetical protein
MVWRNAATHTIKTTSRLTSLGKLATTVLRRGTRFVIEGQRRENANKYLQIRELTRFRQASSVARGVL